MGFLYDLLYSLAALVLAPFWALKRREGWRERFGHVPDDKTPSDKGARPRVLLHAVSVGEVNALRNLVPRLTKHYDVVISTTTDTGTARAAELFADSCPVVRYPLDFSRCVKRFLDAVQPDMVVLTELELWPNFARNCHKRKIPLAIVNGRLSKRSFRRYVLILPLLWLTFRRLAFVAVQDHAYAKRFQTMGTRKDRIHVTGSMKWDAVDVSADPDGAEELRRKMGIDPNRVFVVAGSTAPDEHRMLHRAVPRGAQLLCAPRRPEWFDDAFDELSPCTRWSTITTPILPSTKNERFLLDTIGQLRHAYELADIAVIGRSFGRLYGSDPMEPAALDCALVIGPAVDDFLDAVEKLEAADAIVRTTRTELDAVIKDLIANEARRKELAANAKKCVAAMQGGSQRNAALIEQTLPPPTKRSSKKPKKQRPAGRKAGRSKTKR